MLRYAEHFFCYFFNASPYEINCSLLRVDVYCNGGVW